MSESLKQLGIKERDPGHPIPASFDHLGSASQASPSMDRTRGLGLTDTLSFPHPSD